MAGSRPLSVRSLADFALVTSPPRSSSPPAAAWFASPHPKVPARQPAARPAFPAHRLPATIISIPCPSYHYERAAAHENQPPTALRPRNEHGSIDNELPAPCCTRQLLCISTRTPPSCPVVTSLTTCPAETPGSAWRVRFGHYVLTPTTASPSPTGARSFALRTRAPPTPFCADVHYSGLIGVLLHQCSRQHANNNSTRSS